MKINDVIKEDVALEGEVIQMQPRNPLNQNIITQLKSLSQTALGLFWGGSNAPTAMQGGIAQMSQQEQTRLFNRVQAQLKALGYEDSIVEEDMDLLSLHSLAREAWYDSGKPMSQYRGLPDLEYNDETNSLRIIDLIGADDAGTVYDKNVYEQGEGNFVGDFPQPNIGGATVKPMQVGDTVTYFGQTAKIQAQSPDRKHSRIAITKGTGGVVQTVLTSDLKRVHQGLAEGMAQDEAEEYSGWRAELVNQINYNTFEVKMTNTRSKESANFIVRPVDMISHGPTLQIETMDVHDLQTGQTASWTSDDPQPDGGIVYAIAMMFWDNKELQKKLWTIVDQSKDQDLMPGLNQRRSIGQEVDADAYIDSQEKTQAAMDKMKKGMAEEFRPTTGQAMGIRSQTAQKMNPDNSKFVWKRPNQIMGSHSENELRALKFRYSTKHNVWGGTQQMWNQLEGTLKEFSPIKPPTATGGGFGGNKDYGQPTSSRYLGNNKFVVGTTNNYVLTATVDKWGLEWDDDDNIWYLDSPGAVYIADATEGEIELPAPQEQRNQIHDLVSDYLNARNSAELQRVAAYYGHSDDGEMATSEGIRVPAQQILGTKNRAKTAYYPTNVKPKVPKLDKPLTDQELARLSQLAGIKTNK